MRKILFNLLAVASSIFLLEYFILDTLVFSKISLCLYSLYEGASSFLIDQSLKYFISTALLGIILLVFRTKLINNDSLKTINIPIYFVLTLVVNYGTFNKCHESVLQYMLCNSIFAISVILLINLSMRRRKLIYLYSSVFALLSMTYILIPQVMPSLSFEISTTTRSIALKSFCSRSLIDGKTITVEELSNQFKIPILDSTKDIQQIDVGFGTQYFFVLKGEKIVSYTIQYPYWD